MRTCAFAIVGLLALGALSFGAVYPWAYWPLAAGCAAIGVWCIRATRALREPRPRRLSIALAVVAAAIAIQLLPLPYGWFKALTPSADGLLSKLEVGWALQPPAWHALSISPGGTLTALLLFVAFGILLVGLMRAVAYMPLDWLVNQVVMFGLVMALIGIVQRVIGGAGDVPVYGFWRPSGPATPFGPFINRNHFAGWMLLVLPLAVGIASDRAQQARGPFSEGLKSWLNWLMTPDASRFVFATVAILIMALALVLTGSRSGLGSFVVAMAVLAFLAARRARGRTRRLLPALCLGLMIIGAIGWAGVDRTVARFENSSAEFQERTKAWADTIHIARDFPLAGIGFGGYGQAMLFYQTAARHSIYLQAHNEYLQILAEGGVLVAVPILIALGLIVSDIRHRMRGGDEPSTYWLRAGAVAGLVGIATQSLLDFSLQMPGNAMMCIVLVAIALHRPSATHAHRV